MALSWETSIDNVGVAGYRVHRSTSADFAVSPVNRIGETAGRTFDDFVAAGAYFYRVVALDAAGNVSEASAAVEGVSLADTTSPAVSVTSPQGNATVPGL